MTNVFYRSPLHHHPVVTRAEGVYLYDDDDKQFLDGSGGAAISCLGHGNRTVIDAIREQSGSLPFAHTLFFTKRPQEELAEKLVARFGEDDARVYFLSGGSEANETAIKLARQYWLARARDKKHLVVARGYIHQGIVDAFHEHPHVGDIRDRGLFTGIEMVEGRENRTGMRSM